MNLKQAIQDDKLDEFIKERQKESGDQEQFDSTLSSMVGKSKATHQPSSQNKSEN
jgi:hypothetical protein